MDFLFLTLFIKSYLYLINSHFFTLDVAQNSKELFIKTYCWFMFFNAADCKVDSFIDTEIMIGVTLSHDHGKRQS